MATVLIVDDEPDIRSLIAIQLSIAGHHVIEAAEGRSAIDLINAGGIDVVLLDLVMPKMDGWAVLWTLHDLPMHPPVIVMSGRPEYDFDHPPLGAARYLHKPFQTDEAVASVTELLAAQG
ncbi:MAG TPA: response regulator [Acidimicrobiales bacterium]|nr:response regulator [Acidimicrobiales bacterium]